MPHTYEYPRPALTVDCVVFGMDAESLKVLLIERAHDPYAGCWALPGGFVDMDETIDTAARRELAEETKLKISYVEQLYTFGDVDRDPRGRVVSVAYYALVKLADQKAEAASDASDAQWFDVDRLPKLAFDHARIMKVARERLRAKVRYQPIGFELLPRRFALSQLQELYEKILGRELDKRNFRRKILALDVLVEVGKQKTGVAHRAARLYRFDKRKYDRLVKSGVNFEI